MQAKIRLFTDFSKFFLLFLAVFYQKCIIFAVMKKILFLVYHGFAADSGISKKIYDQVKGLRENGHEVHLCCYDFDARGHHCRMVDGQVVCDCGTGVWAGIRQRTSYGCIYDYCLQHEIQMVYARCFQNASPWLIRLFSRLREAGIKAVTEIPTYPYDTEFRHFPLKERLDLRMDQLFRERLYRQMDAVVTFTGATKIFGQRTIRISNGVDFDRNPVLQFRPVDDAVHLIGVAEVHYWHGYDRMIKGLGNYYDVSKAEDKKRRDIYFHIVGGMGTHGEELQQLAGRCGVARHVVFHGKLFGDALTAVFNQCQLAVGSLGRHRSGITDIKTLKNREYATRGIPFIYSEQDGDFDGQPYVMRIAADESPVPIADVLRFMDECSLKPEEIRSTVRHLTWKVQMQRVVDGVFGAS
jgi:hypothetical protein